MAQSTILIPHAAPLVREGAGQESCPVVIGEVEFLMNKLVRIECSTDSPARSRHAILTESPYKRHFCGLEVHAVRRVLGLLPSLCEKGLRNLICQNLFAQAGKETQ